MGEKGDCAHWIEVGHRRLVCESPLGHAGQHTCSGTAYFGIGPFEVNDGADVSIAWAEPDNASSKVPNG